MFFTKNKHLIRWVIIIASFGIISLILWNTYVFFQQFKAEERTKMENWSAAQNKLIKLISESDENGNITDDTVLILKILNSNTTTPILVINADNSISNYSNIDCNDKDIAIYVEKKQREIN